MKEIKAPNTSTTKNTSRYKWLLLVLLFLAYFFYQADRAIFGIVASLIEDDLNLSKAEIGLTGSALFFVLAIMVPVAGFIGDRYSKKWIITASILFWSLSTGLTGLCTGLFGLIFFRSVATAGTESFYGPASTALIAAFHKKTRAIALSIHQSAVYTGVMVTGFLAGWIAENYGWRTAFYLFGAFGAVIGLICIPLLKDAPEEKKEGNDDPIDVNESTGQAIENVPAGSTDQVKLALNKRKSDAPTRSLADELAKKELMQKESQLNVSQQNISEEGDSTCYSLDFEIGNSDPNDTGSDTAIDLLNDSDTDFGINKSELAKILAEDKQNSQFQTGIVELSSSLSPINIVRRLICIPTVWLLTFGFIAIVFVNNAYLIWAPTLLSEKFNLNVTAAGGYSMLYHHLAALLFILLGGALSDYLVKKYVTFRVHLQWITMLCGVPAIYLIGNMSSLTSILIMTALFGAMRGLYESNTHAAIFEVVPKQYRASLVGLMIMAAFLIGAISPWMMGKFQDEFGTLNGLARGFTCLAISWIIGGIAVFIAAFFTFKRDRQNIIELQQESDSDDSE